MLDTINDILDYSKLGSGKFILENAPFMIADLTDDLASAMSPEAFRKDIEFIVRIDPELPSCLVGDVDRLRQVASSLLGNAIRFTEQGHVFLNITAIDNGFEELQRLRFEVQDTGIGMKDADQEEIRSRFFCADNLVTRNHDGIRLGLYISASIVRLMGGELQFNSSFGKGSTFWFEIELPVSNVTEVKRENRDISGSRVLIVDDNEINRTILQEQLHGWNLEYASVSSGSAALALLDKSCRNSLPVDCVILDYQMPGLNGEHVLNAMRTDPRFAKLPVVMLTSVNTTEAGLPITSLDIQGHLTKPCLASTLQETLAYALKHKSKVFEGNREAIDVVKRLSA